MNLITAEKSDRYKNIVIVTKSSCLFWNSGDEDLQ